MLNTCMNPSSVSIILPTYNESGHIIDLIKLIADSIPPGWEYSIIVVDDSSPDGTYSLVKDSFAFDQRVIPLLRLSERGLAKSIMTGIEHASSEYIVVMDADFTHDPSEIPRFLTLAQAYSLVSGSRFCSGGRMQDTSHYFASMLFNWILRLILRTQIQDNLGGYWVSQTSLVKRLPMHRIFFGYGDYFFRLLQHMQRSGATIIEAPAKYTSRKTGHSKSSFVKMLFTYSIAALSLSNELPHVSTSRSSINQ